MPKKLTDRLIYQNLNSKESFADKEAQNLDKVSQAVRESFTARLELKEQIDAKLNPVAEERAKYQQIIDNLKAEMAKSAEDKVSHTETFFGQQVEFVMHKNGQYEEFVGGQSVNFLNWAIAQKKGNESLSQ